MAHFRRFWPWIGLSALVLALLGYGVISYRVADGVTKLERQPLTPAADGESLGGGSAIMTVGLDPTVGPVVTDSAYADGYTVVSEVGTKYTGLPSWFTPGITITARVFFGLDVWSVRPAEVVRAHPERAWLFIQCDDDKTVFPHHGVDLRAASANADTQLWTVPGCDHVQAFTTHPTEWTQHVFAFLDREVAKS